MFNSGAPAVRNYGTNDAMAAALAAADKGPKKILHHSAPGLHQAHAGANLVNKASVAHAY